MPKAIEPLSTPAQKRIRDALNEITSGCDVLRMMVVANITCGEPIEGTSVQIMAGLINAAASDANDALDDIRRPAPRDVTGSAAS